ncbi:MAG: hypothetical protein AAF710_09360 [Planctomycetota bacterium]
MLRLTREKSRWGRSEVWLDVFDWAHTPGLELRVRALWLESRKTLKLDIPTRLRDVGVAAHMPAEIARRPADGREYACHDWVMLEGRLEGQPASLTLVNDGTASYSVDAGRLRSVIARAVPPAEHPPFEYTDDRNVRMLDQGWQERRFGVFADDHAAEPGRAHRRAQELRVPAQAWPDSGHPGEREWEDPVLDIHPASVATLAWRPEHDGSVRLRLQHCGATPVEAAVTWRGVRHMRSMGPWRLGTWCVSRDGIREC